MSIDWAGVFAWIKSNEIILGLLLSAIVITMPEMLPHWREFPQWMWSWLRDAMKTFMNFRHSGAPISDVQHDQQQALTTKDTAKKLPDPPTGPQQLNG
jgi:hypothetical protein